MEPSVFVEVIEQSHKSWKRYGWNSHWRWLLESPFSKGLRLSAFRGRGRMPETFLCNQQTNVSNQWRAFNVRMICISSLSRHNCMVLSRMVYRCNRRIFPVLFVNKGCSKQMEEGKTTLIFIRLLCGWLKGSQIKHCNAQSRIIFTLLL